MLPVAHGAAVLTEQTLADPCNGGGERRRDLICRPTGKGTWDPPNLAEGGGEGDVSGNTRKADVVWCQW